MKKEEEIIRFLQNERYSLQKENKGFQELIDSLKGENAELIEDIDKLQKENEQLKNDLKLKNETLIKLAIKGIK